MSLSLETVLGCELAKVFLVKTFKIIGLNAGCVAT
jgi:hypothetical protein